MIPRRAHRAPVRLPAGKARIERAVAEEVLCASGCRIGREEDGHQDACGMLYSSACEAQSSRAALLPLNLTKMRESVKIVFLKLLGRPRPMDRHVQPSSTA